MAYDLDQFIADCRSSLRVIPAHTGANRHGNVERLLANKDS